MLPAKRRVRRREDFTTTVRQGRRVGGSGLVLHAYEQGSEAAPPRAGFIVGRVVGPAVVRNRLRRRLRHLIATRLDRLPTGTMLVVRASAPAAYQTHSQLAATLDSLLGRLERRPC